MEPQSYAPTSTTSFTLPHSYHEEVTRSSLSKSPAEKEVLNSVAEVYSILTVLQLIENSFIKDYITNKEKYTTTSLRLISQYQIIIASFKEEPLKIAIIGNMFPGLNSSFDNFLSLFASKFLLDCPLAIKRLSSGIPVTIEQSASNDISRSATPAGTPVATGNTRLIAETTSNFITCMDALKLNYKTKDQLHPLLSELVINLNELIEESPKFEFQGKSKLISWLIKLNNLGDAELSATEIEEFLDDLNLSYKKFYMTL